MALVVMLTLTLSTYGDIPRVSASVDKCDDAGTWPDLLMPDPVTWNKNGEIYDCKDEWNEPPRRN